jgi:HlyD family secretion protein
MKRFLPVVIVVVVAVVATIIVRARRGHSDGALAATGTVEATDARLGFDAAGRVQAVLVHEGDPVTAGQVVAVLDTTMLHAQLVQARAQAQFARARLVELERGSRPEEIEQARARAVAANERLRLARVDLRRTTMLSEGGALSQEALDQARTALDVAVSDSIQAAQALELARQGPRVETIEAQKAEVARADAAVVGVQAALALMHARAPFGGVVTVRHREPGETVSPGSPAVTITNLEDRWVRIYIPETAIGRVRLRQKASITCDSFPDKSYEGEVSYIASEAEFTPKNVQTAQERVKLVYMVKVRVTGDPGHDLKPGMPADVQLEEGTS